VAVRGARRGSPGQRAGPPAPRVPLSLCSRSTSHTLGFEAPLKCALAQPVWLSDRFGRSPANRWTATRALHPHSCHSGEGRGRAVVGTPISELGQFLKQNFRLLAVERHDLDLKQVLHQPACPRQVPPVPQAVCPVKRIRQPVGAVADTPPNLTE
jgi:hypothetical protein